MNEEEKQEKMLYEKEQNEMEKFEKKKRILHKKNQWNVRRKIKENDNNLKHKNLTILLQMRRTANVKLLTLQFCMIQEWLPKKLNS